MTVQNWFWIVTTSLLGLCIGSFMNVVIWRLPRNGSLVDPQWSYCPNCTHRLGAIDLIPLLSYLFRGRRCGYCKQPISSRYFWVELLTGVLFVVMYVRFRNEPANAIAFTAFAALLVPIYCVDMELFEIPSQLNLLAFVVALARDGYGIATHEPGHQLIGGWLPVSLLGGFVGIAVFGGVRTLGWLWKHQEAMGLGDVILARAMGAMLVSMVPAIASPLRLIPIWVLLSCGSGAIVGPAMLYSRRRKQTEPVTITVDEPEVDDSNILLELRMIGYVVWCEDAFEYLTYVFKSKPAEQPADSEDEDNWEPAASAIPFGPFMVIGFLATLLVGEPFTAMYLAYALPKAGLPIAP